MPELTPEQQQAFGRVLAHADKLFEALDDLAAAGGLAGLSGRIKPSSVEKAAAALRSIRQAVDEQLGGLKGARRANPNKVKCRAIVPDTSPDRPPVPTASVLEIVPQPMPKSSQRIATTSAADVRPIRFGRTGMCAVGARGPRGGRVRRS